jgi:hypothetical protein
MSRHHIQLPPIIYVTPPKPKKLERRRSLRRIQFRSDGSIKDTDEAAEIDEKIGLGQPASANNPLPDNLSPIDGSERKPKSTSGLLSQGTLKEMLLVQEKSQLDAVLAAPHDHEAE